MDQPVVVLGDINEWLPLSRPLRWLHGLLGKPPWQRTFPVWAPMFALDRVWVRPRGSLLSFSVHRTDAVAHGVRSLSGQSASSRREAVRVTRAACRHDPPSFTTRGRLIKESVIEWIDDRASRKGAALAFYTVFSLAPILILAIAIAGFFFGQDAARGEIFAQVRDLVGPDGARRSRP